MGSSNCELQESVVFVSLMNGSWHFGLELHIVGFVFRELEIFVVVFGGGSKPSGTEVPGPQNFNQTSCKSHIPDLSASSACTFPVSITHMGVSENRVYLVLGTL